ncbi:MAG: MscL family protein [Hymenobacter sp.]|nr:MAG: MscL family protein [Hymenobacter sp.]
MSFISEFKEFISKGNVLDLAVGVIIGAAFGNITAGPLKIGLFINAVINFLIIAVIIFFIVKGANSLKKKPEPVVVVSEPAPSKEQLLLTEIRDALRTRA